MKKTMNRRGFLKNSLLVGGVAAALPSFGSEGIGQTTSTAFDSSGSVGHSMHTLFVRPR